MIKEKSLVRVINGPHAFRIGRVSSLYPDLDIALIECTEGFGLCKVRISDLVEMPAQDNEEPKEEPKDEIPEGAKVIKAKDFIAASAHAIATDRKSGDFALNMLEDMSTAIVAAMVTKKIFDGRESVVMTRTECIDALWDACSPQTIRENTTDGFSDKGFIVVALAAISKLHKVADILFDE